MFANDCDFSTYIKVCPLQLVCLCSARLVSVMDQCLHYVMACSLISDVQIFIHRILYLVQHLHEVSRFRLFIITCSLHVTAFRLFYFCVCVCVQQGGKGAESSRGPQCCAPARSLGTTRTAAGKAERVCF